MAHSLNLTKNLVTYLICLCFCKIVFLATLFAHSPFDDYLTLLQQYPETLGPLGDASKGEIEIIVDKNKMEEVEHLTGRRVGIIARDNYYIWINDVCKFPGGSYGVMGRVNFVRNMKGLSGASVLPVLPDGRIVLNCIFRHATRSWQIELPRGVSNPGENPMETAKRQALEETGMEVDYLELLGELTPAPGLTSAVVPIYVAKVMAKQERHTDDSKAIGEIFVLTLEEIEKALVLGYYEGMVLQEWRRVPVRDSHIAYAILLYKLKKDQLCSANIIK